MTCVSSDTILNPQTCALLNMSQWFRARCAALRRGPSRPT